MKILILAQTPPPYHGQAIMQKYLADANWNWCDKKFIRLNYSKSSESVGKFTPLKVFKLFIVVFKVWKENFNSKIDILFYPPSGPNKIPFYRDVLTLLLIRKCTKKIIFQFHAGGFDKLYNNLNRAEKFFALKIYNKPDAAIVLLKNLENEIKWIEPGKIFIVPNGVEDRCNNFQSNFKNSEKIKILTAGLLAESKGILVSLKAGAILKEKNYNFEWIFMGNWQSEKIRKGAEIEIKKYNLKDNIKFLGMVEGNMKWELYADAGIFCLPTFENEAMPLVILEAMMMSLPIVTTNWREIPEIIDNRKNGLLVPINNAVRLAESIQKLMDNKNLRTELGKSARKKYLQQFTIENHLTKIEKVFREVGKIV